MTDQLTHCPNCSAELAFAGAHFCTVCGTPVAANEKRAPAARTSPDTKTKPRREQRSPRAAARGSPPGALALDPMPPPPSARAEARIDNREDEWEISVVANEPAPATAGALETNPAEASVLEAGPSDVQSEQGKLPDEKPVETNEDDKAEAATVEQEVGKDVQMVQTVEEKRTVVEEGTKFKGTLESTCPIVVNGRVEGELQAPSMTVSASGAVHGKAKVGKINSRGELSGEFDAEHVELAGTVRDNTVIRAETMEVKLAAKRGKMQVIFGECEPEEARTGANGQLVGKSQPPPALRPSRPPPEA
jgi:cytoskeletal protein CcmA (bactofilin family)